MNEQTKFTDLISLMGSTRIFSLLNIIFHSNIFSQSKRWEQEWKCSTCNFVAFGRNPIQPDQVMSHVALSARIQSAKAASKCASNRAHLRYNDVSEKNYMITPPLSLPPSLSLSSFLPSFLFSFRFARSTSRILQLRVGEQQSHLYTYNFVYNLVP